MRNFYLTAKVDGRKTLLTAGPRSKYGGFDLHIQQRDKGIITSAIKVTGYADGPDLVLNVYAEDGNLITTIRSVR